jgi:hypothetical protein
MVRTAKNAAAINPLWLKVIVLRIDYLLFHLWIRYGPVCL